MPKALNLTGKRFGKLVALSKAPSRNGKTYWLCQCDCGKQKEIQTTHLTNSKTQSCGCLVNGEKEPRQKFENCLCCGQPLSTHQYKFCSKKCQKDFEYRDYIQRWKNGEVSGTKNGGFSAYIKRYMLEKANFQCELCGWHKRNIYSDTIPLELHHKDGNRDNNKEENLQILCPNCHALTPNYRGLNR